MKLARAIGWFCCGLALLVQAGSASAGNALILNVPDWDQPDDYAPVGGMVVGDAPSWCSPTSGANLMGYWEDQKGYNGLTDGSVFGASPAFPTPANAGWQQNNWHDCTIEMGFFMDSGTWASRAVNPGVWPPGAGWTQLINIGPGAATFAGWKGYPNIPFSKDVWPGPPPTFTQAMAQTFWNRYVADIDASEPVLCSFDVWVTPGVVGAVVVNEQTVAKHDFAQGTSPHTVVGVGYLDANTALLGDEWFITQDNKTWTGQYVAVPFNWQQTEWRQNDYVAIPEPATMSLLAFGVCVPLLRKRK